MESFKCAYDEIIDLHKVQPNPKNANKHPEKQIELLAKIIDYQGQRSPIVISKRSGFLVKGHGRLEAIKTLGWNRIAVDYQDYDSEAQEYADVVADNKIAELAEHDDAMMVNTLREMDFDLDFDLLGVPNFTMLTDDEYVDLEETKQESEKKYKIEISFPNDMDMMDLHDDLMSKGYMVKVL